MLDLHVHSVLSGDASSSIQEMCARAVEMGITTLAFTEHLDHNPVDMCYGMFDLNRYMQEIHEARSRFSRLTILTGVEFAEPHLYPSELEGISAWELDVVLGAVHWVGDDLAAIDTLENTDVPDLYRRYFEDVLKTAELGGFDVLAHIDLVKRFGVKYLGPFALEEYREQIAAVLKAIIRHGIALEVNTSGLRQPCAEPFPALETLKLYRDLGGELVTIGSDSHSIRQLGFGLAEGLEMIRTAGFDSIVVYRDRRPELYGI